MKFCPMCGCQLPDEAVFCGSCGANLQSEIPAAPVYQTPPPQSGYQPSQPATPVPPARRGVRAGMLAAALLCIAGGIVALLKPALLPYSLPAAIALFILAVMFLVLAWSPREARGLLGRATGLSQGAFVGLLVALAIVIPVVGEAGEILPQEYKLIGTWRMAGEDRGLLLKLERGSFTVSAPGENAVSGKWSYKGGVLILTPSLFSGEEPIMGTAQLIGNMMTFSIPDEDAILLYRNS